MALGTDFHPGDVISDLPNYTEVRQEFLDQSIFEVPMDTHWFSSFILHVIVTIDASVFVLGIIANVIACIVIACSKSMLTPTNCYLFSLSMSDLLLLVTGAMNRMYDRFYSESLYSGTVGCFLEGWVAEIAVSVSVITITAFTYERYLAFCRLFVLYAMSQVPRAKKLIVIIWLVTILSSLPLAFQYRYEQFEDVSSYCGFDKRIIPYSREVSTTLFFVIPMSAITVMYILIVINRVRTTRMETISLSSRSKRSLMLIFITVLAFFLCWMPFHLQRLMTVHFYDAGEGFLLSFFKAHYYVTYISGITYFLPALINPFVYSIMSSKFREAFEELMHRW